jgi:flagellar hook-basal body complex protein FliE
MRLYHSLNLVPPEKSRKGSVAGSMSNTRVEFEEALSRVGVDIRHLEEAVQEAEGEVRGSEEADLSAMITASEHARRSYALLAKVRDRMLELYHALLRDEGTE